MPLLDHIRRFFELPPRPQPKPDIKLDAALFHNMCLALHGEAPRGSAILVMDARMDVPGGCCPDSEGDGCEFDCYVKKSTGKNARFQPSAETCEKLCGWLRELRESMLSQKQPRWKGLKLTVDVPGDKYNADFRY